MVVKSQIKFIKSLQQKKYRTQHQMFVAEGIRTVEELLGSHFRAEAIYTADPELFKGSTVERNQITSSELHRMSGMKSPNKVLAVFHIPPPAKTDPADWAVALDGVKDPGNLGTIIRLCDWFGITQMVCSRDTVDCYNPKVLQATMGSIARVNINYAFLPDVLKESPHPIFGAFMEGQNVYAEPLPEAGILVMGNEANGVSKEVEALLTKKICIPQFGVKSAESLNVAMATAILLNEIRRISTGH